VLDAWADPGMFFAIAADDRSADWLMIADLGGAIVQVPLAPSHSGDPRRLPAHRRLRRDRRAHRAVPGGEPMTRTKVTDEEAWDYYSKPEHQQMGEGPVVRPPRPTRMKDAVPIRFHDATVEAVKEFADADGVTVSEWIRRLVNREIEARRGQPSADDAEIADELERLARRLRRSA
jgi:hypothetical protein